jgi:hypothetical protein
MKTLPQIFYAHVRRLTRAQPRKRVLEYRLSAEDNEFRKRTLA